MIKQFLNHKVNKNDFLIANNRTITRLEFANHIQILAEKLAKFDLNNEFIYIKTDKPINFYILLFACWFNNTKVVLPTKLSLENNEIPIYAKYVVEYNNNNLIINKNIHYDKINITSGDSIVFSSGSTGKPKGVVHKKENFFINALETSKLLNLEQNLVSLTFLKPYLVSAISHMLVHWYNESVLIFDDLNNIANIGDYRFLSNELNIVGSPIHMVACIKYLKDNDINPRFFFSSGDMISDANIKQILELFNNVIFFKVYGLAEVAGRLFIKKITIDEDCYDLGNHLSNAEIEYIDNEVVVKTNMLFSGYVKDDVFHSQREKFFTSDLVDLICDDKRVLKGRKNDEIKIAGHKVMTKYLENKILINLKESFNVDLAVVVPIPHHLLGNILALVIATDSSHIKKNKLFKSLKYDLKNYELPHKFYFIGLKEIPFTQSMKVDRNKIKVMILNNKLKEMN